MNIPLATYRIQFGPSFGFVQMKEFASYLADLGISHIYASPIFMPVKGSTHGYDVVDPNRLNPELGTDDDFESMIDHLRIHEMGWIQDIVPNHMAYHPGNRMLMDALETGQASPYFRFFDIDWDHHSAGLRGRLLAPFLGLYFGECLESAEIAVVYDHEGLGIAYYDLRFPLRVESYAALLTYRLESLKSALGEDHPDYIKFLGVLYVLETLRQEPGSERYNQTRFVKRMLWELYRSNHHIQAFVEDNLRTFNGEKGKPDSFALIDRLLSEQLFRLAFWKVATEEINYRRFFTINGLVSCRVEDKMVFDHTHELAVELVRRGVFSGIRIDHLDGLYDPLGYLRRWRDQAPDVYIVVEKILQPQEALSTFWPVAGTTGYDFLNCATGLLCDRKNEKAIGRIYAGLSGLKEPLALVVRQKRRLIIQEQMAGDVENLAQLLKRVSGRDRHGADATLDGLRRALTEVLIEFPVYRTYVSGQSFTDEDRRYLSSAVDRASAANPALLYELEFLRQFLLLHIPDYASEEEKTEWLDFTMRFQQLTGPLMAKAFEDTALYVYNRLLSLNEVGGSPARFGLTVGEFHDFNEARNKAWPHTMNATATHDTKRGEDARARINVLSEVPEEWEKQLKKWHGINRARKRFVFGKRVPDRNDEYFLYQTLIGAFPYEEDLNPEFVQRIKEYIVKAVREAKIHTAWITPDRAYEEAYLAFVESILTPAASDFLAAFVPFQRKIAHYGALNSLSQVLLKITAPGVPDFYQGTELWDFSLVDPDNRRPVDYEKRRAILGELKERSTYDLLGMIRDLLNAKEDGRIKLFVIHKALAARRFMSDVFLKGRYLPLQTVGRFKDRVVAFARTYENRSALTIVPRCLTAMVGEGELPLGTEIWQDTGVLLSPEIPQQWRNCHTNEELFTIGRSLAVGAALKGLPVALLASEKTL